MVIRRKGERAMIHKCKGYMPPVAIATQLEQIFVSLDAEAPE